jgi:hypothetical protein
MVVNGKFDDDHIICYVHLVNYQHIYCTLLNIRTHIQINI